MYKKRSIILLSFLSSLLTSAAAQTQEIRAVDNKRTVVLGVVEFPPLVMKDNDGNGCHGQAIEVSSLVLEKLGYNVSVECPPPARLFERIRKGHVDITVNVRGTKALENNVIFVEKPFSFLSLMIMTNPKLDKRKTVAAIRGYDYEGLRQELEDDNYIFVDMANSSDAIQMFQFGRTTHLVTYEGPYMAYIDSASEVIKDVVISIRRDIPTFFAISKASKLKQPLLQELDDMFRSTDADTIIELMSAESQ